MSTKVYRQNGRPGQAKKASISEDYKDYQEWVLEFLNVWKPEPEDAWLVNYLRNRLNTNHQLAEGTFNIIARKVNRLILRDFYHMDFDEIKKMSPNELFRTMYREQKRLNWSHQQTKMWISCIQRI